VNQRTQETGTRHEREVTRGRNFRGEVENAKGMRRRDNADVNEALEGGKRENVSSRWSKYETRIDFEEVRGSTLFAKETSPSVVLLYDPT
jgi:hypothetical protein